MSGPFADVYVDESSQSGHRYLVLGAIVIAKSEVAAVRERFAKERVRLSLGKEMKWGRVSNSKLNAYLAMLNTLFEYIENDTIHFKCLTVDTSTFDHATHNAGDREAGFNKLIYQLLLHRCGKAYGRTYRFEVYLDYRDTNQKPDDLRKMLNAACARDFNIKHSPFRSIVFSDSKKCDLIQICDVVIGAVAYLKNGHNIRPDANRARCAIATHLVRKVKACQVPKTREIGAYRFAVWNFRYNNAQA